MQSKIAMPHGFNHQSFYRQPVLNLRPINQIVSTDQNNQRRVEFVSPTTQTVSHPVASSAFTRVHGNNSLRLVLKPNGDSSFTPKQELTESTNHDTFFVSDHSTNGLTDQFLSATRIRRSPSTSPKPTHHSNGFPQNTSENRLSRSDHRRATQNESTNSSKALIHSQSSSSIFNHIQKERRAHTMAPSSRILGPCSMPTANMFASVVAPSDAQVIKSVNSRKAEILPEISHSSPLTTVSNHLSNQTQDTCEDTDATGEDFDNDTEEDNAPIIVKVRYDPDAGGPPPEDFIRQTLNNQLNGNAGQKIHKDPIVLDFSGNQPSSNGLAKIPMRPQQPVFNRPAIANPQMLQKTPYNNMMQFNQRPQLGQQTNIRQTPSIAKYPQSLSEQQRQALFLQEQERQKHIVRQRQEFIQQQKNNQHIEQYMQQQKQRQTQQLLYQEQKQQQQIQEMQSKNQQYRSSDNQPMLNSGQYKIPTAQSKSQPRQLNPSLPPIVPRTTPAVTQARHPVTQRPTIMLVPNTIIRSSNGFPVIPTPISKSGPTRNLRPETIAPRILKPGLAPSHSYSGFESLSSYAPKYIASMFIPINAGAFDQQMFTSMKTGTNGQTSQNPLSRPHTAPSSTERYRPSSALDVPELSQDNLRTMLNQIPDLRGRRFSIEYAEEETTDGFPIPTTGQDETDEKYPEATIVDQLPSNIIRHVQNSNNPALVAALQSNLVNEREFQSTNFNHGHAPLLNKYTINGQYHQPTPMTQRLYLS